MILWGGGLTPPPFVDKLYVHNHGSIFYVRNLQIPLLPGPTNFPRAHLFVTVWRSYLRVEELGCKIETSYGFFFQMSLVTYFLKLLILLRDGKKEFSSSPYWIFFYNIVFEATLQRWPHNSWIYPQPAKKCFMLTPTVKPSISFGFSFFVSFNTFFSRSFFLSKWQVSNYKGFYWRILK